MMAAEDVYNRPFLSSYPEQACLWVWLCSRSADLRTDPQNRARLSFYRAKRGPAGLIYSPNGGNILFVRKMIIAAITALGEKNGSNKTSISKYIESQQGNLPPTHTTLLSHHLNKMKNNGQLIFWKNNYMKPDPNAPPRRGRGRPPKDPNAPLKPVKPKLPSAVGSGRPRGRPRKTPKTMEEEEYGTASTSTVVSMTTGTGRPRGRPPKVNPATFTEVN